MEQSDDASLREIAETLWRAKWLIAIVTLVFGLSAGLSAWLLPPKYRASVVLSPVNSSSSGAGLGNLGGIASQLSGIASLAGVSLATDNFRSETLATLQSDVLTRRFIDQQHILSDLLPHEARISGRQSNEDGQLIELERATEKFKKISDLSENSRTGLVTFSVTWTDPVLASNWANEMVELTNDYMRDRAIRRSENNIAYLSQQAAKTDIAGVREAIYTILESEIKNAMLARGTDEYALTVIDPAVPPEKPWSPRIFVWLAVGAMSGLFLSLFFVLVRKAWARSA